MNIAIFKKSNYMNKEIEDKLLSLIKKYHHNVNQDKPDVVIFIGGDGTFLRAVQHYLSKLDDIVFIGLNSGHLGFFYDFDLNSVEDMFIQLEENSVQHHKFNLLEANFSYKDSVETIYAVNEIRIESPFSTLISNVYIDGELLELFRGNGLCVSSSLGSTALNRSLGGALIHHDLKLLELSEISSIQNSKFHSLNSSLIIPSKSVITFKGEFFDVVIGFDHLTKKVDDLKQIDISLSNKEVNVLYSKEHTYLKSIRKGFID